MQHNSHDSAAASQVVLLLRCYMGSFTKSEFDNWLLRVIRTSWCGAQYSRRLFRPLLSSSYGKHLFDEDSNYIRVLQIQRFEGCRVAAIQVFW